MRIDIRDSKYSVIYNEKTGAVEDVLWCNESAEDLKNLNVVWPTWPVNWPCIGRRVSLCSPGQRPSVT